MKLIYKSTIKDANTTGNLPNHNNQEGGNCIVLKKHQKTEVLKNILRLISGLSPKLNRAISEIKDTDIQALNDKLCLSMMEIYIQDLQSARQRDLEIRKLYHGINWRTDLLLIVSFGFLMYIMLFMIQNINTLSKDGKVTICSLSMFLASIIRSIIVFELGLHNIIADTKKKGV